MLVGPRVSVVIAAYNAEDYLGAAISSCLTQTHPEVETVVVDDGSTDGTAKVAAAYGDRITFVRQDNAGCAAARNTAIAHSTGDYIAVCDSDDILMPHHVETCLATLRAAPARTWVCADAVQFTDAGLGGHVLPYGQIPADEQRAAILQANIATVFGFVSRAMLDEVGLFDSSLRYAEDWDLWTRAIFAGWRVTATETPTALYRVRSNSMSHHQDAMIEAERSIFANLRRHHSAALEPEELAHVDRRLERGSARDLMRGADAALAAGEWAEAARLLSLAATDFPLDRRLQHKARLLRIAPSAGRLLVHRRARSAR